MARSRYEYGTNPRKLQPDNEPRRNTSKKNLRVVKRENVRISRQQKDKQIKSTLLVLFIFAILLTISYRNSQISEKFSQIQSQKKELATLQKENEQLEITIQNSQTINNVEKLAKEKLGMQKLSNKQTVYINLPKEDYVEAATEDVIIKDEKNWFEKIIDKIFNR